MFEIELGNTVGHSQCDMRQLRKEFGFGCGTIIFYVCHFVCMNHVLSKWTCHPHNLKKNVSWCSLFSDDSKCAFFPLTFEVCMQKTLLLAVMNVSLIVFVMHRTCWHFLFCNPCYAKYNGRKHFFYPIMLALFYIKMIFSFVY